MHSPEWFEKRDIDTYLDTIGAYVLKPATYGMGKSGAPDRVCCYRTMFIGIEVKRPGKEPTPVQERRMAEIKARGGIAIWGDAEKVIRELKCLFPSA
jgi:Holliday junction resolvase